MRRVDALSGIALVAQPVAPGDLAPIFVFPSNATYFRQLLYKSDLIVLHLIDKGLNSEIPLPIERRSRDLRSFWLIAWRET